MPLPLQCGADQDAERQLLSIDDSSALGEFLKPIMAGARARGVAEVLELLGIGAVLIDGTGEICMPPIGASA